MTIDINKKYQTRDGRPVRLLCVDAKGDYPVVGLVLNNDGEDAESWTLDGVWDIGATYRADLVEIPTPRTVWLNIYEGNSIYVGASSTREAADDQATSDRIACVEITYRPGDGLKKDGE